MSRHRLCACFSPPSPPDLIPLLWRIAVAKPHHADGAVRALPCLCQCGRTTAPVSSPRRATSTRRRRSAAPSARRARGWSCAPPHPGGRGTGPCVISGPISAGDAGFRIHRALGSGVLSLSSLGTKRRRTPGACADAAAGPSRFGKAFGAADREAEAPAWRARTLRSRTHRLGLFRATHAFAQRQGARRRPPGRGHGAHQQGRPWRGAKLRQRPPDGRGLSCSWRAAAMTLPSVSSTFQRHQAD